MKYRIDATFRGKKNEVLFRQQPVWSGTAVSATEAVDAAYGTVAGICKQDKRIDVIGLKVIGEDKSAVMTTEYAEDYLIGRGASAINSSNLAEEGIEINLSDEQRAQAEQHLKQRAVDSLSPESKQKLLDQASAKTEEEDEIDPVADFFGGQRPSEKGGTSVDVDGFPGSGKDNGVGHSRSQQGADKGASESQHLHPQRNVTCDKTFATCKDKYSNEQRFGGPHFITSKGEVSRCSHSFGDKGCGIKRPIVQPRPMEASRQREDLGKDQELPGTDKGYKRGHASGTLSSEVKSKAFGKSLLEWVEEGVRDLERAGRSATGILVNKEHAKSIGKALGLPAGTSVDGGRYKGLKIKVGDLNEPKRPKMLLRESISYSIVTTDNFTKGHEQMEKSLDRLRRQQAKFKQGS